MARLIEIQDAGTCPSPLTVRIGDVLLFRVAGGRILTGGDFVELIGSFLPAVIGDNGEILAPIGPPSAVLTLARQQGQATIAVITGDPFHQTQTTELRLIVSPAESP